MLHALNVYSNTCQLFFSKTGCKERKCFYVCGSLLIAFQAYLSSFNLEIEPEIWVLSERVATKLTTDCISQPPLQLGISM